MTGGSDAETIRDLQRRNERLSAKYDEVFMELEELKRGPGEFKDDLLIAAWWFRKKPDADEKYEGEYRRRDAGDALFALWGYLRKDLGFTQDQLQPLEALRAALGSAHIGFQDPLTDAKLYDKTVRKRGSSKGVQEMLDDARLVWVVDVLIQAVDAKMFAELEGFPMDRAPASDSEDLEDEGVPDLLHGNDKKGQEKFFRDLELTDCPGSSEATSGQDVGDEADAWLRANEESGGFSEHGIKRTNIEKLTTGKKDTEAMELVVKALGLAGDPALHLVKRLRNLRKNANKMPDVQAAEYRRAKESGERFVAERITEGHTKHEAQRTLMDRALSRLREDVGCVA